MYSRNAVAAGRLMALSGNKIKIFLGILAFMLLSLIALSIFSLTSTTEYLPGYTLAYASGVSMILLPCTFPMVLAMIPLVGMAGGVRRGLLTAIIFGIGVAISMSIFGGALAALGAYIGLDKGPRLGFGIGGLAALILALAGLGLVKTKVPGLNIGTGRILKGMPFYASALVFGLTLGDAGIGCPNPAFFVLASYIATVGDVVQGGTLGLLHGVGRATPLLFVAALALMGVNIRGGLAKARERLFTVANFAFLGVGAFFLSVALFGGWWCYSTIHWQWDSVIGSFAFPISEAAAGDVHVDPVSPGWEYGSWFMVAAVAGSIFAYSKGVTKRISEMSTGNSLLLITVLGLAVIGTIVYSPIVPLYDIHEFGFTLTDSGLYALVGLAAGASMYAFVKQTRSNAQRESSGVRRG
ncbi:MAG: hypothetical protein ACE5KO_01335 [Candidatus Bathyarchaeia archaeon]